MRPRRWQPPGSPIPGILQARILEWVAIAFSNAQKWKVKVKSLSHVRLLATPWTAAYQAPPSMGFSKQEYWSGVPLPSPTTMWEIAKELITDHSMIIWHLKQIGKVKMFDKWVPRELTTNLKNCRFEVSSSIILPNNNKPFLHRIMTCDEKWILYCNWWWTSSVVELRISSKALS